MKTTDSGTTDAGLCEGTTFSADLLAQDATPILLVEIDIPGNPQRLSTIPVRYVDAFYRGKIVNVGTIRRSVPQNLGMFEVSSVQVEVADTDMSIASLIDSFQIKGVAARIKLGTSRVTRDDYITILEGLVDDFGVANFRFQFTLKDRLWTIPEKPDTGLLNTTDFPHALPADIGKPYPFCYGTHSVTEANDANDYKNRGGWPTLFVDVSSGSRTFLIANHAIKTIDKVYAYVDSLGSQELTVTTDYVPYTAGVLNGKTRAYVILTSSGWAKVTDTNGRLGAITVNVTGKETLGDGTGALITNPADVLADLLANYLGNPPRNDASFLLAKSLCSDRSYTASGGCVEEEDSASLIQELCASFSMRVFPDNQGRVSVDIFSPEYDEDVRNWNDQWHLLSDVFSVDHQSGFQGAEDSVVVNRVDFQAKKHWANGIFLVGDTSTSSGSIAEYGEKPLVTKMPWNDSAAGAKDVADRIVSTYDAPVSNLNAAVPLFGVQYDLTEQLDVTSQGGTMAGGYAGRRFEITEHELDPMRFRISCKLLDVTELTSGVFRLGDESAWTVGTGSASVTNGSGNITVDGGTTGVQVGDIIVLARDDYEANCMMCKVTGIVDGTHVSVANTTWTTDSGIAYQIVRSWLTATAAQKVYGHLCDEATGQMSNGDPGFKLL